MRILLIESIFFKKADEWYIECQHVITGDKVFHKRSSKKVASIKKKRRKPTPGHKELLNLFNDLLDIVLTDKTLELESQDDKNKNDNEKVESRKVESRKEEYEDEDENEDEDEDEDEDDDETMDQNKKSEIIKEINDNLDEIIDKSKTFEEQIKSLKKEKI